MTVVTMSSLLLSESLFQSSDNKTYSEGGRLFSSKVYSPSKTEFTRQFSCLSSTATITYLLLDTEMHLHV